MTRFILASASPRRKQLLEQAGYAFEIVVSDADESRWQLGWIGLLVSLYRPVVALGKRECGRLRAVVRGAVQ